MRYALLTVANPTDAFILFAHRLANDHILLATHGTATSLTAGNVSRVREVNTTFLQRSDVDTALFKTVDASLYTKLTHGSYVCAPGEIAGEIKIVVVGFKPCKPPFGRNNRPDIGGPALAKVAALAALYHGRPLFVLVGSNLGEKDYREFLVSYLADEYPAGQWLKSAESYARRALQAVAAYETEVANLAMNE